MSQLVGDNLGTMVNAVPSAMTIIGVNALLYAIVNAAAGINMWESGRCCQYVGAMVSTLA